MTETTCPDCDGDGARMSWLLDALTEAYARADELDRAHDTEYDGTSYITPSLIGHDDQEDTNGPA